MTLTIEQVSNGFIVTNSSDPTVAIASSYYDISDLARKFFTQQEVELA